VVHLWAFFFLIQVIYQGNLLCCHPNYQFSPDWDITHSPKHWSNEDTMIQHVKNIIAPYVKSTHGAFEGKTPASVITDNFKGQITTSMTDLLESNNIHICCIPTASFHYGNWRAEGHVLWILTNHGDVMPSSSHMHGKKHHEIHLDTYQYTEIPHGKMRPKAGSLILWTTLVWTGRPWCTCSGPSHLLRVYMCTACRAVGSCFRLVRPYNRSVSI